jgi:hypothetical protein
MSAVKRAVSADRTYRVVSVEKTEPPAGIEGGSWYCYIITLDSETIVGNRRGTLRQVTQYAEDSAQNLSVRVTHGISPWSSRRNK